MVLPWSICAEDVLSCGLLCFGRAGKIAGETRNISWTPARSCFLSLNLQTSLVICKKVSPCCFCNIAQRSLWKFFQWFQQKLSHCLLIFPSQLQVIALKKCADKGLRLATSTCKCKPSHSTFGTGAFQMQINSHWAGFTSCGVQCTQPPTQKWEWHRKL